MTALAACGGGSAPLPSADGAGTGGTGSRPPPPPPFVAYTVGGTVSNLVGRGLVLRLTGLNYTRPQTLDQLAAGGNGSFQFATTIGSSGPKGNDIYPDLFHYSVSIAQQPESPAQRCVASDRYADFVIAANVADVGVVCGEWFYSTNSADNTIAAFSVDAFTGALVSVGAPLLAGRSPYAVISTGGKEHLFVANADSNELSAFAVDPHSGALTAIPGSPFATGTRPRALALFRSTLIVANAGSDNLSVYRVDAKSGVPTPWSSATYATGANPSVIAIVGGGDPYGFGPVVYVANAGSDDISAFWLLGVYGPAQALEPVGPPFPSGSSVTSFAYGKGFLYAANANGLDATISGYSIDTNTGALSGLANFPLALRSCDAIAADQTGAYLYAAAGTNLLGYSIDARTGSLSPLSGFPVAVGADADSISIDPTNQFLYVRNGSAGTVRGFLLDAATGALAPMPGSPFAVGKSADFIATF
jgi:6-phosphogluconolactonase (cycloisomerase 2 family)